MARLRFRGSKPRKNSPWLLVAIGAVTGLALGVMLADRAGGLEGLSPRAIKAKRRRARETDEDVLESHRMAAGAEHSDFEFDDDEEAELLDASERYDDDGGAPFADAMGVTAARHATVAAPPDEAELEARVLEVFRNDPMLQGQAIDIGAIGDGVIELTGWATSAAEVRYAVTLARGVPDVHSVMDSLSVRKSSWSRVGSLAPDR